MYRHSKLSTPALTLIVICIQLLGFYQSSFSSSVREKYALDGTWYFKTDAYGKGEQEKWYEHKEQYQYWETIQVPGNWDLKNEYASYTGSAWYIREFQMEPTWENRNISVIFESVYHDATVWVNGRLVGENKIGYLPFSFNLNEYLRMGETNRIVVMVDNTHRRGAMWNWGGIRRPVSLEITDKSRLEYQHITAIPDLEAGTAQGNIVFEISNHTDNSESLHYEATVTKDTDVVWSFKSKANLTVDGQQSEKVEIPFAVAKEDVKLWHFNSPTLYRSVLRLYRGETLIDEISNRFGIRKIEVDGEVIKLNGEPIRTVGFNLVPEDRTTGSTLPLWRIMEDVDIMKGLGANMARISHQPLPEAFLDYLDEKGIMTFEEVTLWGKDAMATPNASIPKEWLSRMIKQKYNHPSVIGWSVGNEIGYVHANPDVMAYVEGAIRQTKEIDPHRLAVYVSHSAATQNIDPIQFSDVLMYNKYEGWGTNAEKVHQNNPGKPLFYSEYGYTITEEDPDKGAINVGEMLNEIRGKPYLMGASYWAFNDYRSAYVGTPASGNRSWGLVNSFRQKKRAYFEFKKEYAPIQSLKLNGMTEVIVTPRDVLDIPAYTLRGYRLVWEAVGNDGKLIDGGFNTLSDIHPGDDKISYNLTWNNNLESANEIKISLLDPQSYSVYDTVAHLKVPKAPEIISGHAEQKTIRVIFKKDSSATAWKAHYKGKGNVKETAETINDFIDIPDLTLDEEYEVMIIAVNSFGESAPSIPLKLKVGAGELPPVIWHTDPQAEGFFIGYATDEKDDRYQVQYGTSSGDYENFHLLQLPTKGAGFVSITKTDRPYYFRMRRLMQWGYSGEWTHEIKVASANERMPVVPTGVLKNGKERLLVFNPPKKTVGYQVRYTALNTGMTYNYDICGSQINYIVIKNLEEGEDYNFEIAAMGENGLSEFVTF